MKKWVLCLVILLKVVQSGKTQSTRYIVEFKDKGSSPYSLASPSAYLSQRAIDRRTRYSITIDSTDLPVTPRYIDSVRLAGAVTILNTSKWLNSVSIQTTDAAALAKINSFPFVKSTAPIAARTTGNSNKFIESPERQSPGLLKTEGINDFYNYGQSFAQVHIHNGEFLHNIGLRGQTMIIGMLDAGFRNYTSLHAFDSVVANNQVLGVYDFVAHDNSVVEDDAHGMECFSTMAANIPGQFTGTAPKANFYLFRTEDVATEYPIEEHNWVCGAERIDSAGGDVITSSLGYTTFDNPSFNHTYADMNGHTTMAAIGAGQAAKKGILVVNSAGNDGADSWHYISTPADNDSVMAVGAVAANGSVASFSSFGPSSDGRIKPDAASVGQGTTIELTSNTVGSGSGTSFACPNLAGLSTCLWQGFQEFNNIKILNALRKAASIASAPDNRIGYGIPDVKKAVMNLLKDFSTANAGANNCTSTINWTSKDVANMKYEIERRGPGETIFTKIAEQLGTGTIFSNHSYQYTDALNAIVPGSITYRIRQIIDTATSTMVADYIDTVVVNLAASCGTISNDIKIIPNPVQASFNVRITTPDAVPALQVQIVNMLGQVIYRLTTTKPAGTLDIPIVINLPKAKYFVNVYNARQLIGTKVLLRL